MLNVLSISQNFHLRGGSDKIFLETTKMLLEKGHRAIPFAARASRNEPTPWGHYFPAAADFEHPGPRDVLRYIYSLPARHAVAGLLRDEKPDLAHLHIYYGKLTASILAPLKKAGIPIVQTLHEYKLICPVYTLVSNGQICEACHGGHFYHALPRRCNRGSLARTVLSVAESYVSRWAGALSDVDHFIAVSDFMRDKVIEHGVLPEKITRVYNFVDSSGIVQNTTPGNYLLYFGRLERIKGIFTLLDAIAPLKHAPLKIVGDGNARADIEKHIRKNNLSQVEMLGFKSGMELYELIHNSLGVVVPSQWYEPFPTTVLEAFADGRPVIGSAIGGIPEMIDDGQNGILVPPGDIDVLREKILWLIDHPHQTVDMGQTGRKKVETLFTIERYYQNLMAVYQKILG